MTLELVLRPTFITIQAKTFAPLLQNEQQLALTYGHLTRRLCSTARNLATSQGHCACD